MIVTTIPGAHAQSSSSSTSVTTAETLAQEWFTDNFDDNETHLAVGVNSALKNLTSSDVMCYGFPSVQRRTKEASPNGGCPEIYTAVNASCSCLTTGYSDSDTWEFHVTLRTDEGSEKYPTTLTSSDVLAVDSIRTLLVPSNLTTLRFVGEGTYPQTITFVPQDQGLPGSTLPIAKVEDGSIGITTVSLENINLSSITQSVSTFFPSTTLNITLRNCNMIKFGYDFFDGLDSVRYLDMSSNHLTAAYVGSSIAHSCSNQFCAVEVLNLTNNSISTFPTVVFNVDNLQELYIAENDITDFNISSTVFSAIQALVAFDSDLPDESTACTDGTWQTAHNRKFCVTNDTATAADTSSNDSSSLTIGLVAGGCAIVIIIVALVAWRYLSHKKTHRMSSSKNDFYSQEFGDTLDFDDTQVQVDPVFLNDPVIVTNRIDQKLLKMGRCISKEALSYLHALKPKIIHRDLKSKNVLLNMYLEAKLSDFGISRMRYLVETHMTAGVGTSFWIAPEVLLGRDYDEAADIFSFGVVLSEIDTDDYPYWNDKNTSNRGKIQEAEILSLVAEGKLRPSFSNDCPKAILDLADCCLQKNPEDRPNAAEIVVILEHMIHASERSSSSLQSGAWSVTSSDEEAQRLRQEVKHLTSELQELQFRTLSPEDVAFLDPAMQRIVVENRLLTSVAKGEQLKVATAQSLLAASLGPQESHPLYTQICLTKSWSERRKSLMAVRQQKLQDAYGFLMGRFEDPDKPHTSDHRYETPEGDICAVHAEVIHFPRVESLDKVWEAVIFHYNNIEIDISEKLGHMTVRDDYDSIEGIVHNIRVLSHSENCTSVESSIVTFSHFFTEDDEGFGGQPCGVLSIDCIDEDELYPYYPEKRVRLDTSGAIVLTANREGDGELVAFWEGYVDYIGSKTCKHYYDMVRDARERGCGEKDKALRGTECREMFQWYVDNKEVVETDCYELKGSKPFYREFVYYDFNGTTGLVLNGKAATSSCAPFKPTDYSKYAGAADVREATLEVTLTEQLEAIRLETRDTENHTTSGRIAVETAMLGHRDVFQASEEKRRCPVRLRLTASQPHQVSSVWYAQQLPVLQGFETRFTFQITDQSRRCFEVKDQNFGLHEYQSCAVHGGDGFAFVLHSHQNRTATLAAEGSNMGFAGLQNSLAIEFDTWFNDKNAGEDVFYDHVAIYSRGQKSNTDAENARMSAAVVHDLADGKVHVVKIRYYPELKYNYMPYFSATTNLTKFIKDVSEGRRVGTLLVFMDDGIKNDKPILAIPINLAATLRLDSDEAFVGFTASTSSSWQKHDVLGWYYCTEPPCLDQYDTEMTFDFDYNEQSMYSTASHSNTLYPIFIYPDTVSWAKRQAYFAANQKVGLVS
ncbi:hypothetical protein JG687_00005230 [Phytophthora cactorum]|uniref:Protein kinase domain-containing protein n=1 Tax=Phytophthora cactorum TaxID=29920 RepID=A0A8T1ULE9_9STRA|nr:hypothetical protein JG687_00005230 [Phytophthora cactorum]